MLIYWIDLGYIEHLGANLNILKKTWVISNTLIFLNQNIENYDSYALPWFEE